MSLHKMKSVLKQIKPYREAWAKENQKMLQSSLPLWVVLGDSMSQGIGATSYRNGWVGQALDMLQTKGKRYAVINLSKSGAKIEDILTTQLPAMKQLTIQPAVITLLVGSNDLFAPRYRRKLLANLEELLKQLPEGTIVGDIFERPETPLLFKPLFTDKRASDLLKRMANRKKLIVIPLGEAFSPPWRDKLASDFFHPNNHGYEGIARLFVEVIQKSTTIPR